MKLGLVCNDHATEEAGYTTTRLGLKAMEMGHEVWLMGVGDFASDPDDNVRAWARAAPETSYPSPAEYLAAVQGDSARVERITVDDLDVLFLRNDPAADLGTRPWAQSAGFVFGQRAAGRFQHFPPEVRPRALISRSVEDIRTFVEEEGGRAVLKPLQGSGGSGVFLVQPSDMGNLNQMIEAVSRDGYVIAQEYLPAAAEGDTRLFLMNGVPLAVDGKYAAFRRISAEGDVRSNVHVGGKTARAEVSDEMLKIAEIVRPRLARDGMFLVGLDIVGNKLLEINVFSPGGLGTATKLEEVDFTAAVIEALEKKVTYRADSRGDVSNLELAML